MELKDSIKEKAAEFAGRFYKERSDSRAGAMHGYEQGFKDALWGFCAEFQTFLKNSLEK